MSNLWEPRGNGGLLVLLGVPRPRPWLEGGGWICKGTIVGYRALALVPALVLDGGTGLVCGGAADASWKSYGDQWINDDKCYISMMINCIYWILKSMNQWW